MRSSTSHRITKRRDVKFGSMLELLDSERITKNGKLVIKISSAPLKFANVQNHILKETELKGISALPPPRV